MKTYGLIGRKLNHSFSKKFFNQKFLSENIPAQYLNFQMDDIDQFRSIFNSKIISGLNVTIPYKRSVIRFIDELDDLSMELMAVNTILPIYNGKELLKLKGFNTDVYGFRQMIKPYLKSHHERVLILGTGGASSAIAYVFKDYNIDVNFISRNPSTNSSNVFGWEELNDHMINFHPLIVNTTPVGMFPNVKETIDLPYRSINKDHLLIDLIYNPSETQFLINGKIKGAQTLNGYDMLVHQALKAWDIWNN